MCSRGKPFLCCGKSKRHRCVPLTSPIQSFEAACSAEARLLDIERLAAAAAPTIRPRKRRRWVALDITISPSEELSPAPRFRVHLRDRNRPAKDDISRDDFVDDNPALRTRKAYVQPLVLDRQLRRVNPQQVEHRSVEI